MYRFLQQYQQKSITGKDIFINRKNNQRVDPSAKWKLKKRETFTDFLHSSFQQYDNNKFELFIISTLRNNRLFCSFGVYFYLLLSIIDKGFL